MPDWKSHIRPLLASLHLSPLREAEIAEELAQHLDDRWRELMARGVGADEAEHTAKTEFSGARLEALLGTLRQAQWRELPPPGPSRAFSFDSVIIDLRHAIRSLRATPSFTLGALLVLALGTGATTAIFSVVDAVALRPLPFPEPGRIVAVGERDPSGKGGGPVKVGPRPNSNGTATATAKAPAGPVGARPAGPAGPTGPPPPGRAPAPRRLPGAKPLDPDALLRFEPQNYLDWVAQQRVFESIAAVADSNDIILQRPDAEPEVVIVHRVTASFFDVLRMRPAIGAVFTSRNEIAGSHRVVVLSDGFWRRQFGGDPAAIGRTLTLNDESFTIAGIMPAGFSYPPGRTKPAEIWMPWVPTPQERVRGGRMRSIYLQSIARLKPDVSIEQAQAQMSQVGASIAAANPMQDMGRTIGVRPLRDHFVGGSTRSWILMLLAAVGIVLIIACANVANLWLARASVQQRDIAVRAALGASRGRLVQRTLIESLVVSIAGAIAGLVIAWPAVRVLRATLPEEMAGIASIGIDLRVLTVASVVALITGLISGIVPALQGSRPVPSSVLYENGRGGVGRGRRRVHGALIVAEVAAAVVLLVGAALFIGSFINVMRVDPGFRTEGVLTAQISPRTSAPGSPGQDRDLSPAVTGIIERARHLPGVVYAAWGSPGAPLRINMQINGLRVTGKAFDGDPSVSLKAVTSDYHRALEIPLKTGRYFEEADRAGSEPVIVLSEAAARVFFPGEDPIGRTASLYSDKIERRVVGVVADARQSSFEVSPHPEVYLPLEQRGSSAGFLVVRTSGDPNSVLPSLRSIVAEILPGEPLRGPTRLEDQIAAQTAERRLNMLMFGLFGLLGLVISAVGLFGVLAYLVTQQTRDIGVRLALGAAPSRIVADVLGHAIGLVGTGLVIGSIAAWSLSGLARRFVFGLDPGDFRLYALAMATLLIAAIAAAALPARRAASISPIEALRND